MKRNNFDNLSNSTYNSNQFFLSKMTSYVHRNKSFHNIFSLIIKTVSYFYTKSPFRRRFQLWMNISHNLSLIKSVWLSKQILPVSPTNSLWWTMPILSIFVHIVVATIIIYQNNLTHLWIFWWISWRSCFFFVHNSGWMPQLLLDAMLILKERLPKY